jgi:hypothetical protein
MKGRQGCNGLHNLGLQLVRGGYLTLGCGYEEHLLIKQIISNLLPCPSPPELEVEYSLYGEFKHCAQSGENAWSRMYKGQSGGEARGDMFEHTYKSKDYTERFMKTMYCNAYAEADPVMSAYDLSGYSHVVDIGGAGGLLMISVCKLYPNIKTTVLDLPVVVEIANEVFSQPPYITDTSIRSRIEWITGDIFGPCDAMPKGDLYVLSHILHDWNDKNCDSILERVFAGLLPGGALLISEILLNDDVGPMYGHIMDSIMLVRGEGKERTFKEFVAMLQNAGFTDVQTKKAFFSTDCIIAYKPKA